MQRIFRLGKKSKVYFYATFNKKIKKIHLLKNGQPINGLTAEHISTLEYDANGEPIKRIKADVTAYLEFETNNNLVLESQVALSHVSVDGAKENHAAEAISNSQPLSFDQARNQALNLWQNALNIHIEGATEKQKRIFYTALYHTKLAPIVHQDVSGEFRGMGKGSIREGEGNYSIHFGKANEETPNFTVYSLWDTFRALHPLKTITEPERAVQYAKNLVQKQKESGLLPKWEHFGDETGTMVGYPAVAVIADAMMKYPKSFTMDERREALAAAVASSTYHPEDFQIGIKMYSSEPTQSTPNISPIPIMVMRPPCFVKMVNQFMRNTPSNPCHMA